MKETIEENSDVFNGFNVTILLREETAKVFKKESEIAVLDYPESEFVIYLFPEYETKRWYKTEKPILNNQYIGTMENERIADSEAYDKIWEKTFPSTRKNQ